MSLCKKHGCAVPCQTCATKFLTSKKFVPVSVLLEVLGNIRAKEGAANALTEIELALVGTPRTAEGIYLYDHFVNKELTSMSQEPYGEVGVCPRCKKEAFLIDIKGGYCPECRRRMSV